jgi:hypothetical protein
MQKKHQNFRIVNGFALCSKHHGCAKDMKQQVDFTPCKYFKKKLLNSKTFL